MYDSVYRRVCGDPSLTEGNGLAAVPRDVPALSQEERWLQNLSDNIELRIAEVMAASLTQIASGAKLEELLNRVQLLNRIAVQIESRFGQLESKFSWMKERLDLAHDNAALASKHISGDLATLLSKVDNLPEIVNTVTDAIKESSQVQTQSLDHMHTALETLHAKVQESVEVKHLEGKSSLLVMPPTADNNEHRTRHPEDSIGTVTTSSMQSFQQFRQRYVDSLQTKSIEFNAVNVDMPCKTMHSEPSRLLEFVHGDLFNAFTSVVIISNTILLGIQANIEVVNAVDGQMGTPTWFHPLNIAMLITFMVELFIRFVAEKASFFVGEYQMWNLFDALMVITAFLEVVFDDIGGNLSFFRVLKIARMFRAVRMLRVFRYVRDLRIMVCSIVSSFVALAWAFFLLAILIYCCAVTFCQGVADHLRSEQNVMDRHYWEKLHEYYRSVPISMYTLVLAISGGMDWHELAAPLSYIGPFQVGMFVAYTLFVIFGMLNVLTGVFVERAQELTSLDRDLVVESQKDNRDSFVVSMKAIFQEADDAGSGLLSWPQFQTYCNRDDVREYFASIELRVDETKELFRLFDVSRKGVVNIDEFVNGCMRLKGNARSFDMLNLHEDVSKVKKLILLIGDQLNSFFDVLGSQAQLIPNTFTTENTRNYT